jgi:hypothetical protein
VVMGDEDCGNMRSASNSCQGSQVVGEKRDCAAG